MNNYELTKCSCGKVVVSSVEGTVKVAGSYNFDLALERLTSGESIDSVANSFCSYCLFPIVNHPSKEEHEKHPGWLPYHEPVPQDNRHV